MAIARSKSKILVLGSLAWEVALTPDGPNNVRRRGAWVGAPIIRKMIREALVEVDGGLSGAKLDSKVKEENKAIEKRLTPKEPGREFLKKERNEITAVFREFRKTSADKKQTALRVHKTYTSPGTGKGLEKYIKGSRAASVDSRHIRPGFSVS
jgi:hypothetical protein